MRRSMLHAAVLAVAAVGLIACSGTAEDASDVLAGSEPTNLIPTEQPTTAAGPGETTVADDSAPDSTTSGEEPDANGNRPTDVVRNFLTASTSADCETLAESIAHWGEEELATCRSKRKPNPNPAKVLSVELEGFYTDPDPALPDLKAGTAVVIATMDWNRGPGEWHFWLHLEDGKWQIYAEGT